MLYKNASPIEKGEGGIPTTRRQTVIMTAEEYELEIKSLCSQLVRFARMANEKECEGDALGSAELAEAARRNVRQAISMMLPTDHTTIDANALASTEKTLVGVSMGGSKWALEPCHVLELYMINCEPEGGWADQAALRRTEYLYERHYEYMSELADCEYASDDPEFVEWELGLVSRLGDALVGAMSE